MDKDKLYKYLSKLYKICIHNSYYICFVNEIIPYLYCANISYADNSIGKRNNYFFA